MKNRKENHLLVYGSKPVLELLGSAENKPQRIFIEEGKLDASSDIGRKIQESGISVEYLSSSEIVKKVGEVNHQSVVAQLSEFKYSDFKPWLASLNQDSGEAILILDKIEDTHNFGAIIRTAVAVGVSGIIVGSHFQAPVNGTVFKTSAGHVFGVKIFQVSNINDAIFKLKDAGFWLYGLDMSESEGDMLWSREFDKRTAFVLGSEEKGISRKTLEHCDFVTSIPMTDSVESLNVSVSCALVLYEWKRQIEKDE